jgi:hypothetical protein
LIGAAGEGDTASRMSSIAIAKEAKDWIGKSTRAISGVSNKLGIFSRLSQAAEKMESKQAVVIGTSRFMARNWKLDKGLSRMSKAAEGAIETQAPGMLKVIYQAAESGMNISEIEGAILGEYVKPQIESIIREVENRMNPDNNGVLSDYLKESGIIDRVRQEIEAFDNPTPEDIDAAFDIVENDLDRYVEEQFSREVQHKAEDMRNKIGAEKIPALLQAYGDIEIMIGDHWVNSRKEWEALYARWENLNPGQWHKEVKALFTRQDAEWRRVFELETQTIAGAIQSLGIENEHTQAYINNLDALHQVWKKYYEDAARLRRVYFDGIDSRPGEPSAAYKNRRRIEWDRLQDDLNDMYKQSVAQEAGIQTEMDSHFANAYTQATGWDVKEAARWREQIRMIRRTMTEMQIDMRKRTRKMTWLQKQEEYIKFDREYNDQIIKLKEAESNGAIALMRRPAPQTTPPTPGQQPTAPAPSVAPQPTAPAPGPVQPTTAPAPIEVTPHPIIQVQSVIETKIKADDILQEALRGRDEARIKELGHMNRRMARELFRNEFSNLGEDELEGTMVMMDLAADGWARSMNQYPSEFTRDYWYATHIMQGPDGDTTTLSQQGMIPEYARELERQAINGRLLRAVAELQQLTGHLMEPNTTALEKEITHIWMRRTLIDPHLYALADEILTAQGQLKTLNNTNAWYPGLHQAANEVDINKPGWIGRIKEQSSEYVMPDFIKGERIVSCAIKVDDEYIFGDSHQAAIDLAVKRGLLLRDPRTMESYIKPNGMDWDGGGGRFVKTNIGRILDQDQARRAFGFIISGGTETMNRMIDMEDADRGITFSQLSYSELRDMARPWENSTGEYKFDDNGILRLSERKVDTNIGSRLPGELLLGAAMWSTNGKLYVGIDHFAAIKAMVEDGGTTQNDAYGKQKPGGVFTTSGRYLDFSDAVKTFGNNLITSWDLAETNMIILEGESKTLPFFRFKQQLGMPGMFEDIQRRYKLEYIEGAAIEVDGRLVVGDSHWEVMQKAVKKGILLESGRNKYEFLTPNGQEWNGEHLIITTLGRVLGRDEAFKQFGLKNSDFIKQVNEKLRAQDALGLVQDNKATVQFMGDGRALLRAFQGHDVSSLVHEIGHIFRRDLSQADKDIVARVTGLKNAAELDELTERFQNYATMEEAQADPDYQRYVDSEEYFARAYEQYIVSGKVPDIDYIKDFKTGETMKVASLFRRFTDWLMKVYTTLFKNKGRVEGFDKDSSFQVGGRQVDFNTMLSDGRTLKSVFDNILDSEHQGQLPSTFEGLVSERHAEIRGENRNFRLSLSDTMQMARRDVINQLFEGKKSKVEAVKEAVDMTDYRRERWGLVDDVTIHEALAAIEADPRLDPWNKKEVIKISGTQTTAIPVNLPGIKYDLQYAVVDRADLITSDNLQGNKISPNTDYPQEYQPRDRSEATNREQVFEIAAKMEPDWILDEYKMTDSGASIAVEGPDGRLYVVSGNGRQLSIDVTRDQYTDNYSKYMDRQATFAPNYGIDPASYAGMESPRLIRIIKGLTPDQMQEFIADANSRRSKAMSGSESANADAKKIKPENLLSLQSNDQDTIQSALMKPSNNEFVLNFVNSLPATERGAIFQNGKITGEGIIRMKNGIFAAVYQGEAAQKLLSVFANAQNDNIKTLETVFNKTLPQIGKVKAMVALGNLAANLDITAELAYAAGRVSWYRELGNQEFETMDAYLGTPDMFETRPADQIAFDNEIIRDMYAAKSEKGLRDIFRKYSELALAEPNPKQEVVAGVEKPISHSPHDLWKQAKSDLAKEQGVQADLFAVEDEKTAAERAMLNKWATPKGPVPTDQVQAITNNVTAGDYVPFESLEKIPSPIITPTNPGATDTKYLVQTDKGPQDRRITNGKVKTVTGREIPFYKDNGQLKSNAAWGKFLKAVDGWLVEQVGAEALARGDQYFYDTFVKDINKKNLTPSEKDTFNDYLFGEDQPIFVRSKEDIIAQEKGVKAKKLANEVLTTIENGDDLTGDQSKAGFELFQKYPAELAAAQAVGRAGNSIYFQGKADPPAQGIYYSASNQPFNYGTREITGAVYVDGIIAAYVPSDTTGLVKTKINGSDVSLLGLDIVDPNLYVYARDGEIVTIDPTAPHAEAAFTLAQAQGPNVTRTQQFREWFGSGELKDKNGEPFKYYRGSGRIENKFDTTKQTSGMLYGEGIYLTRDEGIAKWYGGANEYYARLHDVLRFGPEAEVLEFLDRTDAILADPAKYGFVYGPKILYNGQTQNYDAWQHPGQSLTKGEEYTTQVTIDLVKKMREDWRRGHGNEKVIPFMQLAGGRELANTLARLAGYDGMQPNDATLVAFYSNDVKLTSNANPTNSPFVFRQEARTPEFTKWFGDGKLLDENGDPEIFYTGTSRELKVLDTEDQSGPMMLGEGTYFSNKKEIAGMYGPRYAVYLRNKNFVDLNSFDSMKEFINKTNDIVDHPKKYGIKLIKNHDKTTNHDFISYEINGKNRGWASLWYDDFKKVREFRDVVKPSDHNQPISFMLNVTGSGFMLSDMARIAGYDGIHLKDNGSETMVVFNSNDAKFASNSTPTESPFLMAQKTREPGKLNDNYTKQFKRWFGDGELIDNAGRPIPYYHGSSRVEDQFDTTKQDGMRMLWGEGVYFASEQWNARTFGPTREFYIRSKDILNMENPQQIDQAIIRTEDMYKNPERYGIEVRPAVGSEADEAMPGGRVEKGFYQTVITINGRIVDRIQDSYKSMKEIYDSTQDMREHWASDEMKPYIKQTSFNGVITEDLIDDLFFSRNLFNQIMRLAGYEGFQVQEHRGRNYLVIFDGKDAKLSSNTRPTESPFVFRQEKKPAYKYFEARELAEATRAAAVQQYDLFFRDLEDIAKQTGTNLVDPGPGWTRETAGIKSAERMTTKLLAGEEVKDALRWSFLIKDQREIETVLTGLQHHGFIITQVKNRFEDANNAGLGGYKDVNVKISRGQGDIVAKEIQLITPAVWKAKTTIGHPLYEIMQQVDRFGDYVDANLGAGMGERINSIFAGISARIYSDAFALDFPFGAERSSLPFTASDNNSMLDSFRPDLLSDSELSSLNDLWNNAILPASTQLAKSPEIKEAAPVDSFTSEGTIGVLVSKELVESLRSFMVKYGSLVESSVVDTESISSPAPSFNNAELQFAQQQPQVPPQPGRPNQVPQPGRPQPAEPAGQAAAFNPMGEVPLNGTPEPEPMGRTLHEVNQKVRATMAQAKDSYKNSLVNNRNFATNQLDPTSQAEVKRWLKRVNDDLLTTKMAAVDFGKNLRDNALLNYSRRYGFDNYLGLASPYQFWYTRSMMNWAKRMIDKPGWMAMYARWRRYQEKNERNVPTRFKGKTRIPSAWLPEWAGGGIFVDPLKQLFPPSQFLQPMDEVQKNEMQVGQKAEEVIKGMVQDGELTQAQADEAIRIQNKTWQQAVTIAEKDLDKDSSPMSLASMMLQPALWWTIPSNIMSGTPEKISVLPITRTGQAVRELGRDTFAEPLTNMVGGALAGPEEYIRSKSGLSQYGQWGEYYIDRMLSNMITEQPVQDVLIAMSERNGNPLYEEAKQRVAYEMSLRTPGVAGLAALKAGANPAQIGLALLTSLFPGGVYPEGELELRGLKTQYDLAYAKFQGGDDKAIESFFDNHPEYEARLALFKEPEERLRQFMINSIWEGYTSLERPNRKVVSQSLGDEFTARFLNTDTRSYESIPTPTLAAWAKVLGKPVPQTPETAMVPDPEPLQLYPPQIAGAAEDYSNLRDKKFPMWYALQTEYYNLSKSDRRAFLGKFPMLINYWDWNRGYKKDHPELAPYFEDIARDRAVEETVSDLESPLVKQLYQYSLGQDLTAGAQKELYRVWKNSGVGITYEEYLKLVASIINP